MTISDKKMRSLIALVTVCLMVSLSILVLPVKAQEQEPLNLTIKPDGSIEPDTDIICARDLSAKMLVLNCFYSVFQSA